MFRLDQNLLLVLLCWIPTTLQRVLAIARAKPPPRMPSFIGSAPVRQRTTMFALRQPSLQGDQGYRHSSRQAFFDSKESDDEGNNEESNAKSSDSRRDRLKDWISNAGGGKPMVQPVRLDGQVVGDSNRPQTSSSPPRIRAKFDSLFTGMPSMNDILGGGSNNSEDENDGEENGDGSRSNPRKRSKRDVDDSWFDEEKKQILANYDEILNGMLAQLKAEREQDPDSLPDNAEELTKSVLKQEMDTEIEETKQTRLMEMLDAYQRGARWDADTSDVSFQDLTDSAKQLMEESEAEYTQQEATRRDAADFIQYQNSVLATEEASRKKEDTYSSQRPAPGENLDQWALDRLKDMVEAREDSDGDEMILDILQDNVAALESDLEKDAGRTNSLQPKTMKEWQMYRSIAARLGMTDKISDNSVPQLSIDDKNALDAQIMTRLESWKDYIAKEERNRMKSGLTRGPKLPFAWQESNLASGDAPMQMPTASDKQSRIDARKRVNKMSIEAMESLLGKTDATRREKLQKEIEFLKSTLEANDYLDIDESSFDNPVEMGAVDTAGLFRSFSSSDEDSALSGDGADRAWDSTPPISQVMETSLPPMARGSVDENQDSREQTASPPKTAFFDNTEEAVYDDGETFSGDSRLGTMEEQKLEAMFRRAGARTIEERNAIREQWESFQDFEKTSRDRSGLSGELDSDTVSSDLKYNISDVLKEDGDFDADAILAAIGPRPVRNKKSLAQSGSRDTNRPSETSLSSVNKEEVMDSLYRAVSAVGGGRYKEDPIAKEQQRASFQELMEMEDEMRGRLEENDVQDLLDSTGYLPSPNADIEYAEEVLSSLGPRPKPKRARIIDAGDFSDMGGVFSDEEEDEDDDDDPDVVDEPDLENIPEWLRKENEETGKVRRTFLGSEISEVFDDTDFEQNIRQLAEYEKRRKGGSQSLGIDISDVLGRNARKSFDYADFNYDDIFLRSPSNGWEGGSFSSRKRNLLDYIELDVRELNALMDHKDSVYSTGVSQYLPRINKPFKDFGAIFRLEGVLLDITGLHLKAWTKVADEYGFKKPLLEDIQLAAVVCPEVAVKDVFFWTDSFLECKKIAEEHTKAMGEAFDTWMKEKGIDPPKLIQNESTKGSLSFDDFPVVRKPTVDVMSQMNEDERLTAISKAWTATANDFGREMPGLSEMLIATTLNPDIAVTKAFRWTSDPLEADSMVRVYRRYLGSESNEGQATSASKSVVAEKPRTQNDVMELHYQAWVSVAESYGFNRPETDEVLAAFVINEPEVACRGFGWSDNPQVLKNVATDFQMALKQLMNDGRENVQAEVPRNLPEPSNAVTTGPSSDELFKVAFDAWSATAISNGFPAPDNEQVQFALSVGPEEAIVNGFDWAVDPYQVTKLVKTYRDELGRRRSNWMIGASQPSTSIQNQAKSQGSQALWEGPSQDDVYRAVFESWTAVAFMSGYLAVDDDQVQFAMSVGPEEAIVNGFGWSNDTVKVTELVGKYKSEISKRRSKWQKSAPSTVQNQQNDDIPMYQWKPDVAKWVASLLDVEMQCSVVSYLDRKQVDVLLQHAGLDLLFPPDKRVSASNGYITDKDQLLGAALRIERRPDHCVVFDSTPHSSVAAHDVEMQSVSMIGPYPSYELLSADTTAASLDALTAVNIRRLFSERVYDQPMADIQQPDPDKRRKKTRFFED